MKPLKPGNKKPRGAGVDKERDRLRVACLKQITSAMADIAVTADWLNKADAGELSEIARRIRRDLGKLEGRVTNLNIMKKRDDTPEDSAHE